MSPFASLKTWIWHIQILFFQICNLKNEEWDDNFGLFLKLKPNFKYLDAFTLFPNISIAYSNKLIESLDSPLYNIVSQNNSVINLMYFQNEIKSKNIISLNKKNV